MEDLKALDDKYDSSLERITEKLKSFSDFENLKDFNSIVPILSIVSQINALASKHPECLAEHFAPLHAKLNLWNLAQPCDTPARISIFEQFIGAYFALLSKFSNFPLVSQKYPHLMPVIVAEKIVQDYRPTTIHAYPPGFVAILRKLDAFGALQRLLELIVSEDDNVHIRIFLKATPVDRLERFLEALLRATWSKYRINRFPYNTIVTEVVYLFGEQGRSVIRTCFTTSTTINLPILRHLLAVSLREHHEDLFRDIFKLVLYTWNDSRYARTGPPRDQRTLAFLLLSLLGLTSQADIRGYPGAGDLLIHGVTVRIDILDETIRTLGMIVGEAYSLLFPTTEAPLNFELEANTNEEVRLGRHCLAYGDWLFHKLNPEAPFVENLLFGPCQVEEQVCPIDEFSNVQCVPHTSSSERTDSVLNISQSIATVEGIPRNAKLQPPRYDYFMKSYLFKDT